MAWYWFTVVDDRQRRLYSQGPRWMSKGAASSEAAALVDSFWDLGSVRVFEWNGKKWVRWL